ncbi:disulfide bond formation protein DsbB [Novosphingobium sp. SG751A]|uniref:disulfide bond formation protein B n=1 Tax=Novosphingobium sp. SG751A TaxID=2587000 RepID=UPI0015543EE8|nr:disulfide bond formation protein B [Novosphingobium sp. SG751A]NOW45442.1 disulfide bond formation protein DsbB [Novosphingobium sp. SG751A]
MKNLSKANLVALAVPLALLGGAYGFQYIGGLVPCEMCWWQRYAHFAALGLAVAAFVLPVKRLFVALSGLALVAASAIGGYHAGVEYGWWKGLTECTTTVSFSNGGDPLAAIMAAPVIRCDVVQWKLMGISMAGFDFLISGAAALVVFALMARNKG